MGILPDQPGGTSLDFNLLGDLFGISADGSIPNLANLTQPFVEDFLKQREIAESPGWLGAHDSAFGGLLPGVALVPNILMNVATSIIGLPFGTWPGTGPLGFIGEVPNILADMGNYFTNLGSLFGGGVDFNDLLFDPVEAVFNFVDTMIVPTDLLASLVGGFIPGGQIPGLDASKIITGEFPMEMITGLVGALGDVPVLGDFLGWFGLDPGGDETDLQNYLGGIPNWSDLLEELTGDTGGLTELADLFTGGLFGMISSDRLGVLPFTHLGAQPRNLLGSFDDPAEIIQGGGWAHDAATGRTSPGHLYVTANGTERSYKSEAIDVQPGQEFSAEMYTRWSGVTGSAPISELRIRRFLNGAFVDVDSYLVSPTGGATQATWVAMQTETGSGSGAYLVPAGTDQIVVELFVPDSTTAGTIRFDDPLGEFVGGMSMDWIPGLPDELSGILEEVQSTWDALYQAFSFLSGTGIPLSNMAGQAQEVAWSAFDALTLGAFHNGILGFRRNRSSSEGLESTMVASQSIESLGQGATPTNFALTQANTAAAVERMPWDAKEGVIQWRSSGNSSITDFRINIYRMDDSGNLSEHLYTSPNLASQLTSGWQWQQHVIDDDEQFDVEMGDIIATEFQVVGAGTVTMAGTPAGWMTDNHPSSRMKRKGFRRNLGTSVFTAGNGTDPTGIASGSIPWNAAYPYAALGINNFPAGYVAPQTWQAPAVAGAHTYTIPVEYRVEGATFDLIALGSGGGGQANYGTLTNYTGGNGGQFATQTITYGVDVPLGATTISVYVGWTDPEGGYWTNGENGRASTVTWNDGTNNHTITAPGGNGGGNSGTSGNNGKSPGSIEFPTASGARYLGGAAVGRNQNGKYPGGGAGGAGPYEFGGDGAMGTVWIRAVFPL